MFLPYLRECKNIGESFKQVWGKKNDFHYLCVDEKKNREVRITNEKRKKKD
jgi:hypothetical protein